MVVGLDPLDPATLVVTTTRAGYATGSREVTWSSLDQKTDPILTVPVTRTADGFMSRIQNVLPGYAYPVSITDPDPAPDGSDVEVVEVGQDHFVKVTGLAENTEVTVTVRMTKDGFAPGLATVTGRSLAQKTDPALTDPVTRTADGFTSKITNWTEGYAYPTTITSPLSVPDGAEAVVEVGEGGFHYLVVRGFGANQPVSVTVGMTKDGFTPGSSVSLERRCRRRWIRR